MLFTAFTVVAMLSALAAVAAAWVAARYALELAEAERALASCARVLKAATDRISIVEGRLDRLAGRVYSQARKRPPDDVLAELEPHERRQFAGSDRSYAGVDQLDPELAAELALQGAPAVSPGSRNGK